MKRLSLPAAFGVVLALLFAGLGGAPAFAGSNPVPIYLKADPCPGASLCGNFLTGQFKGSGKRTTQFAALPNLTVTRASFAYGENADGSLKGFQAGQARVSSKGVGVFEPTTNLVIWSQDYTQGAWTKTDYTITAGAKVAPDGTLTGQLITAGSAGTDTLTSPNATVVASSTETAHWYIAQGNTRWVRLVYGDSTGTDGFNQWVDLSSCSAGSHSLRGAGTWTAAHVTAGPNGWCNIDFTGVASTRTTVTLTIVSATGDASLTRVNGATYYVWGADLRAGAYPVPYCPTAGSTATCAADSSVGFGSYVFGSVGTVVATYLQPAGSAALVSRVIGSSTGSTAPIYISSTVAGGQGTQAAATFNGTTSLVAPIYQSTVTPGRLVTAATAWTGSSRLVYSNGAQTASDANAGGFGTGLWLGSDNGSAQFLNGYITAFAVYPSAFSAAQLQAATQGPDTSSLSLNFASGLYKTTTPYVRTNLVLQSQNFANASWAKTAASAPISATVAAPDGTFTASKLTEDGTTAQHRAVQAVAHTSGVATTFSVYLKAGERTWAFLQQDGVPTGQYFDLINGIAGNSTGTASTARITSAGNGWWRASLTYTPAATGSPGVYVMTATANGTSNYAGDGSSGVYVWGAQVEASPTPTSYIATTAAAASAATTQSVNPADIAALTFTNASGGYAQFSNGTLQWFPANAPRCTDQGCLIEEAATNLETYSQDSSQWTPTNVVVTTGQLAPDGTATAFQVSSTANLNSFVASPIITLANNTTYTSSLYFKPVSGTGVIAIEYTTGTTLVGPTCNALTGSTTNGAVITTYGNGWSRCTVTFTTAATGTPSARVAYVGAYGATATPTTVLLWQKDIVAKAFATSPIPTTSASATRSADVMSYAYTPPTTGTLATSWSAPITPADQFPAFLSDGTLNNRVHFAQSATTGNLNAVVNNGGAVTSFSTANVVTGSGVACGALSYTGGAQIASLNGGTNATAAGATIPTTLSTLTVGGGGAATAARQLNGYVRDVAVFAYAANSNETPYRAACNF